MTNKLPLILLLCCHPSSKHLQHPVKSGPHWVHLLYLTCSLECCLPGVPSHHHHSYTYRVLVGLQILTLILTQLCKVEKVSLRRWKCPAKPHEQEMRTPFSALSMGVPHADSSLLSFIPTLNKHYLTASCGGGHRAHMPGKTKMALPSEGQSPCKDIKQTLSVHRAVWCPHKRQDHLETLIYDFLWTVFADVIKVRISR